MSFNLQEKFGLKGKRALVTGASGGIGKAITEALKNSGAEIVASGTSEEKLAKLSGEISGIKTLVADLSDLENVSSLIGKTEELIGGIDILVNNAGITSDNLAMRMKSEEFDKVLDVNLRSVFRLTQAAIKPMMKQRFGRIINITSIVGSMGSPGQANYCAAKAAVTGMAKSMAQELASRNVTVNNVAPGFIETPMTDKLNEDQKAKIANNIPMGRFGLPKDIAGSVVFLSSDAANYITGQTIHINGGLLMV